MSPHQEEEMGRMSSGGHRERLHIVLPVIVCVMLGACASVGVRPHAAQREAASTDAPNGAPTQVVVSNHSGERMTVYVSYGAAVWRLGDVEPAGDRIFPLGNVGRSLLDRTTFFIGRTLAGATLRSETFEVHPGEGNPTWTIEAHTAVSFVTLR
jgi:hypothetical protein